MDSSRLGYNGGNPTIPAKGLAYWPLTLLHERYSRCSRVSCDSQQRTLAVVGIAILIAVDELRTNFAQVARPDLFSHFTQKESGLGNLPFTNANLIRRLKTDLPGRFIAQTPRFRILSVPKLRQVSWRNRG
jgi:hypothetical protein